MSKIPFFFDSEGQNTYFLNNKKNSIFLCHPIMSHFFEEELSNIDSNKNIFVNKIQNKIEKYIAEDQEYYKIKYNFLRNNGIINTDLNNNLLDVDISENEIENRISNINQLTFEVTDACNLKCKYCGYGDLYDNYDDRINQNLGVNKAKKLLKYLSKRWNLNQNLSYKKPITISFYGGEPLLNFKFINDIVDFSKTLTLKNNYFKYSLTTNGTYLHRHLDFLVNNDFGIIISLDGNKSNNSLRLTQRGKESYKIVLKNINLIKKTHPFFFESNVNFNSVIHSKNSINEVHHFFKTEFNKVPSVGAINSSGIRDDKQVEFLKLFKNINDDFYDSENYNEVNMEMFLNLPDNHSSTLFIHAFSEYVYKNYNELFPIVKVKQHLPTGTCFPFSKKIFVTVSGDIMACERIGSKFKLGKVFDSRIEISANAIAKIYSGLFRKVIIQCEKCFNSETCKQCIFLIKNIADNPNCHGFMSFSKYAKYLANHISYLENNNKILIKIMEEVYVEY